MEVAFSCSEMVQLSVSHEEKCSMYLPDCFAKLGVMFLVLLLFTNVFEVSLKSTLVCFGILDFHF